MAGGADLQTKAVPGSMAHFSTPGVRTPVAVAATSPSTGEPAARALTSDRTAERSHHGQHAGS